MLKGERQKRARRRERNGRLKKEVAAIERGEGEGWEGEVGCGKRKVCLEAIMEVRGGGGEGCFKKMLTDQRGPLC